VSRTLAIASFCVLGATHALAQSPAIALAPSIVVPGVATTAVVTGPPGSFFAILGSSTNAGFSYGGVALRVGSDVQLLATGTLNTSGNATVAVVAPFLGTTLDRFYLQAVVSPSSTFRPPTGSANAVIRNADLVGQMQGPAGPPDPPVRLGRTAAASRSREPCLRGMQAAQRAASV